MLPGMRAGRPTLLERFPPWAVGLGVGLLVSAALLLLRERGAFEPFELSVYDRLLRTPREGALPSRVALIDVREEDLRIYGHPLDDATLARALGELVRHAPRAIGVDLFRDLALPPGGEALRRVVLSNPRIVMIEKAGEEGAFGVPPPDYVKASSQVGFADLPRDPDGTIRRGLVTMEGEGATVSLALRLALRFLIDSGVHAPIAWKGATLQLGDRPVPRFGGEEGGYSAADPNGYQVLLDFRGFGGAERHTLDDLLRGRLPEGALRGRVALLGTVAPSVKDEHLTPLGEASGAELHALLVDQLLAHAIDGVPGIRTLSDRSESLLLLGLGVVAAALAALVRSPALLLLASGSGLGALALLGSASFARGWWLPCAPLAVGWLAAGGSSFAAMSFRERAERTRVMELFGRFLSPNLAREIWERRDEFMDEGRPRARRATVTVLVCDLQGYTAAAEKMEPEELMQWINGYVGGLAAVIAHHGGLVDDYAGDGIKADFGIPIPRISETEVAKDAVAAVECALAMGNELARLNQHVGDQGLPTARLRVGILTGPTVVGLLGSPDRLKYTTVGNTVNTAARLETHDKEGFAREPGESLVRILVGDATRARLGHAYVCEDLGETFLQGKSEAVHVHRVWRREAAEGRKT